MFRISQLKLRGFKSFKYANIEFPENYICLAGPNGSGKSNVCDSIRFVMGEQSLRAMRVKKVKDLIHTGLTTAEVMMVLEDGKDKKYEIRKAIRTDGKILYKLNGKRATRTSVLEVLKQYNLDDSGRNIIAQGKIQRIVEMTGRERRGIIESVAGISDFDKKKKEAERELEQVNTRIREANIIMGERSAHLNELKKEREVALKYRENKENLKLFRGSLLGMEVERLDKEFEEIISSRAELSKKFDERQAELKEVNSQIFDRDKERNELSEQLKKKRATSEGIQSIEKLKASIELKSQLREDKESTSKKLEQDKQELEDQIKLDKKEAAKLIHEIEEFEKELRKIAPKEAEFKVDSSVKKIQNAIEMQQTKLEELRNALSSVSGQLDTLHEVILLKTKQLEEVMDQLKMQRAGASENEESALSSQSKDLATEIANLFDQEKKVNYDLANLDKDLLKVREKIAQLRARTSPQALNPALSVIKDLKDAGTIKGIHGTVADLIKFDPDYTAAVEAALGARLLFVVVDSTDIASKIIQTLKKMKSGRATFIPLDRIKVRPIDRKKNLLINYVNYSPEHSQAMEFAFSDTILVDDIAQAKKTKDERVVTLDGELFEKSGIITGGKLSGSLLASTQIKNMEEDAEKLKEKRKMFMFRLEEIREEGNRKRKDKAEVEVKLKAIEIERRAFKENEERVERLRSQKIELEKEIKEAQTKVSNNKKKKQELLDSIESEAKELTSLKEQLGKEEQRSQEQYDSMNKKKTELASKISSLHATIDGKKKELEIRKTELRKRELELKEISEEYKNLVSEINKIKREVPALRKQLEEDEEKIKQSNKKVEALLTKMNELEEQMRTFGEKRAGIKTKMELIEKEKHQNEIKEATVKTRLVDLKSEYEEYENTEKVDLSKQDLTRKIKECEDVLNSIEAVNMSAIELYEKKNQEIEELNKKISLLSDERKAILSMMGEIEQKKKEIFFETFEAVNKNFQKMLESIPVGEGHLYLDKPDEPFESSLHIKIKKHGREVSIDSLSGGESTLVAIAFTFAIQFFKPAPFYILDEADAALDKQNSRHLAELVRQISKDTQFLAVSHNDTVIEQANAVLGVTRVGGVSKIVGVKLDNTKAK